MSTTIENFKEEFDKVQADNGRGLRTIRRKAFDSLNRLGIPEVKNEEWKYTRIASVFNTSYQFASHTDALPLDQLRMPGHEHANELFFINGKYSVNDSIIRSASLKLLSLEEAAADKYESIIEEHLGHSGKYLQDGINALNTALMNEGVFIHLDKNIILEHPIYVYNITDARTNNVLSQPRSLIYMAEGSQVVIAETFITIGTEQSFTNQVMEIVVEKECHLSHYKVQADLSHTNLVSTTHIRQIGKSYTYSVTISLDGNIVRNNNNLVLEASFCEAHLYGLYFQEADTHVDNHTVVDNVAPNCYSNELYKGILNGNASGVFNGKIFVREQAQKTNAYQSNKNVLLSENASMNTKPQLEIYADDVKCSHGCTIGQLNEEGMFYLQSRGIPHKIARSLLLHGFATDILEKIKLDSFRNYVDHLISQRLELI